MSCNLPTTVCNVKFNSIYDGDTFYVDIPSFPSVFREKMGIRLKGVDTPELRGKTLCEKQKAKEARNFVFHKLYKAKKINLYDCERGKYFRLVCKVEVNGQDLTDMVLKAKLGVPYDGGTKPRPVWCNEK
jgi:endonuclease YncB( thermonuclease family)